MLIACDELCSALFVGKDCHADCTELCPAQALLQASEMSKIETTATCEIRAVIRFLNARGTTAAEIHHQICDVYGEGDAEMGAPFPRKCA